MRRAWAVAMASLLLALTGAGYAAVYSTAATSCAVTITVSSPPLMGSTLAISQTGNSVKAGGCAAFINHAAGSIAIEVAAKSGSVFSASNVTSGSSASFVAKLAGTDSVVVKSHALLDKKEILTGKTTFVVTGGKPSSSPTASPSKSATPTPKHSTTPAVHPDVAPSPANSKSKSAGPHPHATGIKLPPLPPLPTTGLTAIPLGSHPVVAPLLSTTAPSTTVSPSPAAAIIGGPLEHPINNSRGLPVAVAVIVVLGLMTGWGRVLLASGGPVDDDTDPRHRI